MPTYIVPAIVALVMIIGALVFGAMLVDMVLSFDRCAAATDYAACADHVPAVFSPATSR